MPDDGAGVESEFPCRAGTVIGGGHMLHIPSTLDISRSELHKPSHAQFSDAYNQALDFSFEEMHGLASEPIVTRGGTTSRNVLKVFLGWHLREFDDIHEPTLTCSQGHGGTPLARRAGTRSALTSFATPAGKAVRMTPMTTLMSSRTRNVCRKAQLRRQFIQVGSAPSLPGLHWRQKAPAPLPTGEADGALCGPTRSHFCRPLRRPPPADP